jgi:hypothetical protein
MLFEVFGIIGEYFRYMWEELTSFYFVLILGVLPAILTCILDYCMVPSQYFTNLLTVVSILMPLLLNLIILIHYSIERNNKTTNITNLDVAPEIILGLINTKLEYLRHVNSILSFTIFVSILLIATLLIELSHPHKIFEIFVYYLSSHVLINILIVLGRIHHLINYEIDEYKKNNHS